jgi:hypothetical protein
MLYIDNCLINYLIMKNDKDLKLEDLIEEYMKRKSPISKILVKNAKKVGKAQDTYDNKFASIYIIMFLNVIFIIIFVFLLCFIKNKDINFINLF